MVWQEDINKMISEGAASKVIICGFEGDIWSRSEGFTPTDNELQVIVKAIDSNTAFPSELYIEGRQFNVVQETPERVSCKSEDGSGLFLDKADIAFVISIYTAYNKSDQCSSMTASIANKLRE